MECEFFAPYFIPLNLSAKIALEAFFAPVPPGKFSKYISATKLSVQVLMTHCSTLIKIGDAKKYIYHGTNLNRYARIRIEQKFLSGHKFKCIPTGGSFKKYFLSPN